jgi:carbonyl reductase 1
VVKETLQCNYYGTLQATTSLLPLIRQGGRLINVSSTAGSLSSKYSPALRSAFAATNTVSDVTSLMEQFTSAVEAGQEKEQGWPSAAYSVSKSGVTGMTRAIALEERKSGGGRLVNSCCPGYVKTEMTKGRGLRSVDDGARTPVMLALGDIGDVVGEFWQNEKVVEW